MKQDTSLPGAIAVGAVLTLLVAANPFSTDSVAPGIPALRDFFGVTTSEAAL